MANFASNKLKDMLAKGELDFNDAIKAALFDSSDTPNADDSFMSAITGELSTTGYTGGYGGSGRKTLAGVVFTRDDVNDRIKVTFDPIVWAAPFGPATGGPVTARVVLLHETGGSDATAPFLGALDMVWTTNGAQLTVTPHADGVFLVN